MRLVTAGARRLGAVLAPALVATALGCRAGPTATQAANTPGRVRLERAALLACLDAPPETLFEPERLAASPAAGLSVHTFVQETAGCGPVERRYVAYVPPTLGARTRAPIVLVLHGQGASAEIMMTFQTRGTFNRLAAANGFIVVYGNGLPTSFNRAGLPNSGRWRWEQRERRATVDDVDYLARIVDDLSARAVIAGGNDVYLVGQSNGGGMALAAARLRPDAYAGVAAFMPFVGFSPDAPESLVGKRLRRVMLAYSTGDPGLPPGYAVAVLVPLARSWARALGIADRDIESAVEVPLPDVVKEGEDVHCDVEAVLGTRDSTARRLDLRSPTGALRQLVFDRAGHFWPTRAHDDPPPLLTEFGLRNQDVEGADEVWQFLRE
jgi:poly(3-hydroxybutyrate) depolymerase